MIDFGMAVKFDHGIWFKATLQTSSSASFGIRPVASKQLRLPGTSTHDAYLFSMEQGKCVDSFGLQCQGPPETTATSEYFERLASVLQGLP